MFDYAVVTAEFPRRLPLPPLLLVRQHLVRVGEAGKLGVDGGGLLRILIVIICGGLSIGMVLQRGAAVGGANGPRVRTTRFESQDGVRIVRGGVHNAAVVAN